MKTTLNYIFVFALCCLASGVCGQNLKTTIKIQAMDMAKAVINNDFASFVKYMHPKVVEFAGGKEKMRNKMDSADLMMKQFGGEIKKIIVGNPGEIITHNGQLQCVVPQSTRVQSFIGEMYVETSLIAISTDNGKHWYFIDTNIYKADKLKDVLPDLSPKLIIPPRKQPVITPAGNN